MAYGQCKSECFVPNRTKCIFKVVHSWMLGGLVRLHRESKLDIYIFEVLWQICRGKCSNLFDWFIVSTNWSNWESKTLEASYCSADLLLAAHFPHLTFNLLARPFIFRFSLFICLPGKSQLVLHIWCQLKLTGNWLHLIRNVFYHGLNFLYVWPLQGDHFLLY